MASDKARGRAAMMRRAGRRLIRSPWGRVGACLVVLPLAAGLFWAILQANTITGGRFELSPGQIVVLVLLANVGALALLGLIFMALDRVTLRPRRWRRRRQREAGRSGPG